MEERNSSRSDEKKETIVIAEDTEFFRVLLGDVLKAEGYHILFASNGKEALDVLRAHADEISLVVLDIMMPELTGKEVLERLEAEQFQRKFPILVMTGLKRDPEEIRTLRQLGIDGFISKSEPPRFFIDRIKQALKSP
ncbi:response regulator [candidate division CSSED10-310 bacterium]|uniref:Response regulator n=1 Tax=candidate division CSSED10-310 bacterium TaxID=2855610 RepID=A0ABV6YVB8_UNCC1